MGYLGGMPPILLWDHNDSFTRNLEHLLASATGREVVVRPCAEARACGGLDPEAVLTVLSPGPGAPEEHPYYGRLLESGRPVLGICLGMQIINAHFGGRTQELPGCVHGRAESVDFRGLEGFGDARERVARYHSLHVAGPGRGLEITARSDAGVAMALRHHHLPLIGYQFHPESFLTPNGAKFIRHALERLAVA